MIAEPYICIKGPARSHIEFGFVRKDGQFVYFHPESDEGCVALDDRNTWQPYADFEREKLREIRAHCAVGDGFGYIMRRDDVNKPYWNSGELIGYSTHDCESDSESSRLLKRAAFLKAVCEKEGVEWLPAEKPEKRDCKHCNARSPNFVGWDAAECPCDCHKPKKEPRPCKQGFPFCVNPDCQKEPETYTKEEELRKQINDLAEWGTNDPLLVKHFEEEREFRKELLDWIDSHVVPSIGSLGMKGQLEDLRRRYS